MPQPSTGRPVGVLPRREILAQRFEEHGRLIAAEQTREAVDRARGYEL